MDALLKDVYTNVNSPVSFSSVYALYKEAKSRNPNITLKQVKEWVKSQDTYTLHKQTIRRFPRNKIIVSAMDDQWEV